MSSVFVVFVVFVVGALRPFVVRAASDRGHHRTGVQRIDQGTRRGHRRGDLQQVPFSMLDSLTRLDLQDTLLRAWEQNRRIVVMVTHDVDEALFLATAAARR